jgi:hypothetical protein
MATAIEYALMAGASYISNRDEKNSFPTPPSWKKLINPDSYFLDPRSGFEAVSFTKGNEVVISYAGTDFSSLSTDFYYGNIPLALGNLSDQLRQAADYYLQIKQFNPSATITFTGHSLGAGLASLMAVLFDENAYTFDQAPFRATAKGRIVANPDGSVVMRSAAQDLRTYLTGSVPPAMVARLDAYIVALDFANTNKIAGDTLAGREARVTNLNVQGEILSLAPVTLYDRIGVQADANKISINTDGVGRSDLHSQALLTAFLQSGDSPSTTSSQKTLGQATYKLPDLLKMIFDKKLFATDPLNKDNPEENLLERLVKHQTGIGAAIPADAMVTRFTADLWKLVQDNGLTLTDGNAGFFSSATNNISKALTAFAMQMYYEDTANAKDKNKQLFTEVTGGIQLDLANVSKAFAAAFAANEKLDLKDAKGFDLYFKNYLASSAFTGSERQLIESVLPYMRDWYVQAGSNGLAYTDTQNRGAFMLGGNGSDALVGGHHYQFSSCLRTYILACRPIHYPKTAKNSLRDATASCGRIRSGKKITSNAIAACARKQALAADLAIKNGLKIIKNCFVVNLQASQAH